MKKIVLILSIIVLGVLILLSYQHLQYEKALNEVKKTYNEEQELCNIVGVTKNYLYIERSFEEGDYSNWVLTNLKTKKTYNFSLNSDGKGGLVGLKNGEYTLREVSNHCKEDLDTNEYYLKFSENNRSYDFQPSIIDERALVILVLDEDGNAVPGVKIKLYNNLGQLFFSSTTNSKGMIGYEHLYIADSNIFYIVQDGIENPEKIFVKIEKDKIIGVKLYVDDNGVIK